MRMRQATLATAAIAALLLLLAGPGLRFGLWSLRGGFGMLRWAAYLGLAAAAAALLQLLFSSIRGLRPWPLLAALLLGGVAAGVPWYWRRLADRVPPIHDISTDTQDPPGFVAVLPLRAGAPNSATYGGPEVAAAQHEAYPDVRPLDLPATAPRAAFDRALAAARDAGWEIVAADSTAGLIEATATTRWFGFKDDVVVRVRPAGAGSRVDVRSVSRVGRSDVGTNARRVRRYLHDVAERAG